MGRPEKPLCQPAWRTADFPLWKLADYLRWIRDRAGLSYQEMADRTQVSKATLQRAADGKTLPGPETVKAYAVACGRDPRKAVRWRERAAVARRRKRLALARRRKRSIIARSGPASRPGPALTPRPARIVRPDKVTTFDDLVEALACLRREAGMPTLRDLAERDWRWLSPSTTSDLLQRKTHKPRREVVLAFARACGESDAGLTEWEKAWSRARHAPTGSPLVSVLSRGRVTLGSQAEVCTTDL
jgi:transcriptional regulator with XRE-family HTH domain